MQPGLYIVSTPIGNLGDMTERAVLTLKSADIVAAEDTRHSRKLLDHFGVKAEMMSLHDHNERDKAQIVIDRIKEGKVVALVSDAGTPLISDPGYYLVRTARAQGVDVVPVPGVSAVITALSVAGLPTDRFTFEGFLPAKSAARKKALELLQYETRTMVFYESPHRIQACFKDMQLVYGDSRVASFARELTKRFETVRTGTLSELLQLVSEDANQSKGEFVVIVEGAAGERADSTVDMDAKKLIKRLLQDVSVKTAASMAADILGEKKKQMYNLALAIQDES